MANPRFVQLTDRARRVTVLGNPDLAPNPTIVFTGGASVPANALTLGGDTLTLGGDVLTLGA